MFVHALVVENLLLVLWVLTTTVSQHLTVVQFTFHGNLLGSTLMTHCGMDKIVVDLSEHVVIPQTSHVSVRSFLKQLLTTWSFESVGINLYLMKILLLTLFNFTYSELYDNIA